MWRRKAYGKLLKFYPPLFAFLFIASRHYLHGMKQFAVVVLFSFAVAVSNAQSSSRMGFEEYNPVSTLVVPENKVSKAKFPFIDVHNHQWNMDRDHLSGLVSH